MNVDQTYYAAGCIPLISGPGFLTPTFTTGGSNASWYQDIEGLQVISSFKIVPERAISKVISIKSFYARKIGDVPLIAFMNTDAEIFIDTLEGLESVLRASFTKLNYRPYLQRTIARALADGQMLAQADASIAEMLAQDQASPNYIGRVAEVNGIDGKWNKIFPSASSIVNDIQSSHSNILLVGSRGSGKSFIIMNLRRKLQESGKSILFAYHNHDHFPFSISFLLSYYHNFSDEMPELLSAILTKIRRRQPVADGEFSFIKECMNGAFRNLKERNATILIDNIDQFYNSEKHIDIVIPLWLQYREFLKPIFGERKFRVIATTNIVVEERIITPTSRYPGIDEGYYEIKQIDSYGEFSKKKRHEMLRHFLRHDFLFKNSDSTFQEMILNCLPTPNVRHMKNFMREVKNRGAKNVEHLKKIHDEYMHGVFHDIFASYNIVDANKDKVDNILYELTKLLVGEIVGREKDKSEPIQFSAHSTDTISVVMTLLRYGILALGCEKSEDGCTKVSFLNTQSQNWFLKTYGRRRL
jgi:hypothetical protein